MLPFKADALTSLMASLRCKEPKCKPPVCQVVFFGLLIWFRLAGGGVLFAQCQLFHDIPFQSVQLIVELCGELHSGRCLDGCDLP